jgi:hypothetical protein
VKCSLTHDVALVRFEDCDPTNKFLVTIGPAVKFLSEHTGFWAFPGGQIKRLRELTLGSDTISFGYPSSIGLQEMPQIDQNMPLLRKGIIAGINKQQGTLIVDSAVYGGDSGGPVTFRETDNITFCRWYVIGLQSQWVPFRDVWQNARFGYTNQTWLNSGYSVVEPMDEILDMIWK